MTRFVDLHLCASFRDLKLLKKMITKSYTIGYRLIGIPLPPNFDRDEIERIRKICSEVGVDFVSRVDLAPKNTNELLGSLRRLRRRFEVVSVICTSKPIARQAAKDRRVDLLSFPFTKPRSRFFDRAEAELASESLTAFEIDMAPLLTLEGFLRTRLLSSFRRETATAKSFGVPIVISSGATDDYLLRGPHDFSALSILFDMDSSLALSAVSDVPLSIVERNRLKLSPDFVAPGLRVVRRKDP